MELKHYPDSRLQRLLAGAAVWAEIDRTVRARLPANLLPYTRTGGIDNTGCLVLLADNHMAAGRLKMIAPGILPDIRKVYPDICNITVKPTPKIPEKKKTKQIKLDSESGRLLLNAAENLSAHPKLAAAVRRLAAKSEN